MFFVCFVLFCFVLCLVWFGLVWFGLVWFGFFIGHSCIKSCSFKIPPLKRMQSYGFYGILEQYIFRNHQNIFKNEFNNDFKCSQHILGILRITILQKAQNKK